MKMIHLPADIYQQFDADITRDVPGESYGGWKTIPIELPLKRTALVSMHNWSLPGPAVCPGEYRCVEYLTRANEINDKIFPPLLAAVRKAGMPLIHVVGGGSYFQHYPGHKWALKKAGREPKSRIPGALPDKSLAPLWALRTNLGFPGKHNLADVDKAFKNVGFGRGAEPVGNEPVVQNAHQMNAVARALGVSHLVYIGFAINWCLLMSPGSMLEMCGRGYLCSIIRQATTAVENKETARLELNKKEGLWRVALAFGFVFDLKPFLTALAAVTPARKGRA